MAQQVYRGNLTTASFPFISDDAGRTVIIPGQDQVSTPSSSTVGGQIVPAPRIDIPQIYYCHNVMPSTNGVQSVAYTDLIAYVTAGEIGFIGMLPLRDALNRTAYIGWTSDGRFYISKSPFSGWTLANTISAAVGKLVTRAYAQGITYVYIESVGCYKYDFTLDQLVSVTLTGLSTSAVIGITSLAGYLIVWTADTFGWSAVADPTDFVPSLTTGAGSGSVEGAAGSLVVCAAANAGVLAYTTGNVVAVTYTGNSQYPFIFRALPSSGGLKSASHADYDSLSGQQYAYTTSGLQLFDIQKTQPALPEVTDFISGSVFEDCDYITGTFTKTKLGSGVSMIKAVKMIADRYLVVSYGISSFTHAIVYDTQLKRYGKLRIPHVHCVELSLGADSDDVPRHSMGFLQVSGKVVIAEMDDYANIDDAVLVLGKYQYVRSRLIMMDEVELENIEAGDSFTARLLASLDGKNATLKSLTLAESTGYYRRYTCRESGKNHSIMLTGTFSLNSIVLTFHPLGSR